LRSRIQGSIILDIGFVGKGGKLHKSLREVHPAPVWMGIDTNLDAVMSLKISNTIGATAFNLPLASSSVDTVILAEVVEHLYDIGGIVREVQRVLQAGGLLFLTTPNPYSLLLWTNFWLLSKDLIGRSNYRRYLGAADHRVFWEPLSLVNLLYDHGLIVEELTTKNLDIPYARRFWQGARALDLPFWPFNRLGTYTCLIARRVS